MSVSDARIINIEELKKKIIETLKASDYTKSSKTISHTLFKEKFYGVFPENESYLTLLPQLVDSLVADQIITYKKGTIFEDDAAEFFLT